MGPASDITVTGWWHLSQFMASANGFSGPGLGTPASLSLGDEAVAVLETLAQATASVLEGRDAQGAIGRFRAKQRGANFPLPTLKRRPEPAVNRTACAKGGPKGRAS